jgi:hypothetical protein
LARSARSDLDASTMGVHRASGRRPPLVVAGHPGPRSRSERDCGRPARSSVSRDFHRNGAPMACVWRRSLTTQPRLLPAVNRTRQDEGPPKRAPIDLIEALSHPEVVDRLQILSSHRPSARAVDRHPSVRPVTGYAAVLDAVTAVLPAENPLRYIEVHALVERRLRQSVPKSSVKNALLRNSQGKAPTFLRVGYGLYRRA